MLSVTLLPECFGLDTKNGNQRNLPWWGGIEPSLRTQKAYRDKHHPDCEHLFYWREEDTKLDHGGVRLVPGTPIKDFRGSWLTAVAEAHRLNPRVPAGLLFPDLRRSGVRVMVQEAGIPEGQAMTISGHVTRSIFDRYNVVSLKNVQDAGRKLQEWYEARKRKSKGSAKAVPMRGNKSPARPA